MNELFKIFLLVVLITGIWFTYKQWARRKEFRNSLIDIIAGVDKAIAAFNSLTNNNYYFAYSDERNYIETYGPLKQSIVNNYKSIGLASKTEDAITKFLNVYSSLPEIRKSYNDNFVKLEAEKFADLFASLDKYELSADQVEAVVRDEDNNLVVAGAGTGKTTTISAKVAYILRKGLAQPEELLIIAFTKNAANEMFARTQKFCSEILSEKTLDVRTFNSFGYMVKRQSIQDHFKLAFDGDDTDTKAFLQETYDELFINDPIFQNRAVNFIGFFSRPERDEFKFETGNDYMKHESSFKNITLNGLKVKSKEEMEIGNFFYLNKINYIYEHPFPLKDEDQNFDRGQYRPDFYLPDYEIWHEHYGIDRDGNVPPWFTFRPPYTSAREYYHATINWKEGIHQQYNTKLIRTHSYEGSEKKLIQTLKKHLEAYSVKMEKRSPEEMLETIHQLEYYKDFMNLVYTFLNLMKSNNKRPEDFKSISGDVRLKVFLDVFKPLYYKYQERLRIEKCIDYNDMINEATFHINEAHFKKTYKYILVDEFQDMSLGRYELLKSLKKTNPRVKLYGVGDDWQSIFRFTGSDISITTDFEKHFGFTHESHILKTYRFNEDILKVTSAFIQKNPSQIKKELTSDTKTGSRSFSLSGIDFNGKQWEDQKRIKYDKINETLTEIEQFSNGDSVFLIGRYHHNKPGSFAQICTEHPGLKISFHTAHGVKGLTCDYAIILDVDAGKLGFPSEIADDPILNYLLHEGDSFENAEERRVFYVALTRARHKNFIIYDKEKPSKFIDELVLDQVVDNPFTDVVRCPLCTGRMIIRTGRGKIFYGCTNFPLCNGLLPIN